MGLGLDEELLQWLEKYTFPEEAKYSNEEYAKRLYTNLAKELWRNGTTRVALFSSIHRNGTEILMDVVSRAGIGAFVGKVNMDRNSPDFYVESTEESLAATEEWILATKENQKPRIPIITVHQARALNMRRYLFQGYQRHQTYGVQGHKKL